MKYKIFSIILIIAVFSPPGKAKAARQLTSGYELNSTTAGVEFNQHVGTGAASIQGTTKRSGNYAAKFLPASTWGYFEHSITTMAAGRTYYARIYFQLHTSTDHQPIILYLADSGGNLACPITLNTDDTLSLLGYNGGSTIGTSAVLSKDTWYCIEMSYAYTSGNCSARINQAAAFASGSTTASFAANTFRVGCDYLSTIPSAGEWYIDDIAMNDDQGSFQNSFPGSGKVIMLKPNATGDANSFATQTGGTAGAANNYTRVNEVTPDDASTYNGSNTLNQEDLYNFSDSGITPIDLVNVVQVGARFRNNTADATTAAKFEIEKAASGTKYQSAAIVPNSTTWKTNATASPWTYPITLYQDPDSSAWTKATLDTMQIGAKITTGGTNRIDVSNIWATVDYTPQYSPIIIRKSSGPTIFRRNVIFK